MFHNFILVSHSKDFEVRKYSFVDLQLGAKTQYEPHNLGKSKTPLTPKPSKPYLKEMHTFTHRLKTH